MAEVEENSNFALWKSERLQVPNHLLETSVFSEENNLNTVILIIKLLIELKNRKLAVVEKQ